jgi:hypothetical protein
MKQLCKKPKCMYWTLSQREYCRKHQEEINKLSIEIEKELKNEIK